MIFALSSLSATTKNKTKSSVSIRWLNTWAELILVLTGELTGPQFFKFEKIFSLVKFYCTLTESQLFFRVACMLFHQFDTLNESKLPI